MGIPGAVSFSFFLLFFATLKYSYFPACPHLTKLHQLHFFFLLYNLLFISLSFSIVFIIIISFKHVSYGHAISRCNFFFACMFLRKVFSMPVLCQDSDSSEFFFFFFFFDFALSKKILQAPSSLSIIPTRSKVFTTDWKIGHTDPFRKQQ